MTTRATSPVISLGSRAIASSRRSVSVEARFEITASLASSVRVRSRLAAPRRARDVAPRRSPRAASPRAASPRASFRGARDGEAPGDRARARSVFIRVTSIETIDRDHRSIDGTSIDVDRCRSKVDTARLDGADARDDARAAT
jgi:hypothetical protein